LWRVFKWSSAEHVHVVWIRSPEQQHFHTPHFVAGVGRFPRDRGQEEVALLLLHRGLHLLRERVIFFASFQIELILFFSIIVIVIVVVVRNGFVGLSLEEFHDIQVSVFKGVINRAPAGLVSHVWVGTIV